MFCTQLWSKFWFDYFKKWTEFVSRSTKNALIFYNISTSLGGEKYVTLPMVVKGINMLLDKMETEIFSLDNKAERILVQENLIIAFQAVKDKLVKQVLQQNKLDILHRVDSWY